jgi:hypothetical protein
MKKATPAKAKSDRLLRRVGLWATIWWAVSGLYIVLVVWLAKDYYVQRVNGGYRGSTFSTWNWALQEAYAKHNVLHWLITVIVLGWIIGGIVWLKALKQANISYCDGLKDLFLTLR